MTEAWNWNPLTDDEKRAFLGKARFARHAISHPVDAIRWLRDKILVRKPPLEQGIPWFSWYAIRYMRNAIRPGSRIFEWGAGGSTIFFAALGCNVIAVEHDSEWVERVKEAARYRGGGLIDRIEMRHAPLDLSKPTFDPSRSDCARYVNEINEGAPWDYVLVDGIGDTRIPCLREAIKCLNPGGFIALDDAWWPKLSAAPGILAGFRRLQFTGFSPGSRSLTKIDIYEAA